MMSWKALSVSELPVLHTTCAPFLSVMSPISEPGLPTPPVVTMTLLDCRAALSCRSGRTEGVPVGAKVPPMKLIFELLGWGVINTSNGSSSSVPTVPFGARVSVVPL